MLLRGLGAVCAQRIAHAFADATAPAPSQRGRIVRSNKRVGRLNKSRLCASSCVVKKAAPARPKVQLPKAFKQRLLLAGAREHKFARRDSDQGVFAAYSGTPVHEFIVNEFPL